MSLLLLNVLLALVWVALSGEFNSANFLAGFLLGYFTLWLVQRAVGPSRYFSKVLGVVTFVAFFLWELILASLRVALDVMTVGHRMRPGVIAVPLEANSDAEITLLANLITLTPGSLSLDVSTDRSVLYVHEMYIEDVEQVRRRLKAGFERRVLQVLR